MSIPGGYVEAHAAAERLAELTGTDRHEGVVVLGSGWGPAADAFGEPVASFPMARLPGFHVPVAEGHRGTVASYDVGGVPTLVLFGRTHLYEGLGLDPVVHGIRTAAAAGCTTAVLTSATLPTSLAHRVGLADDTFTQTDVGSPFDYGTNALLYPRVGDWCVTEIATGKVVAEGVFDRNWKLP